MIALAAAVGLAVASVAAADKIRTARGIGYDGEITGVGADGLIIVVAGETKKTVAMADISRVTADKYPDLAKAEDAWALGATKGDAKALQEAEKLYKGLMAKEGTAAWLRVLAQFRMFKVYADSGRVAEALDAYLEMLRASPALVGGMKLPSADPSAREDNKEMLKKVDAALDGAGDKPFVGELKSFRAGLVLQEGSAEDVAKILQAALASEDPRIRQPAELKQLELLVTGGQVDKAASCLADYGKTLARMYPADVAYWRGRVCQEQKMYFEAALEFMRLPILYPTKDRARTAESLWRAGQTMEAAKAPKAEVVKVYSEAATGYAGTPGAESAKKELARLGSAK